MKQVEDLLRKELLESERIVGAAKKRMKAVPDGRLRILRKGNRFEYYYKAPCLKERYLKKSEIDVAKQIAQRDYDEDLIKLGEERIKAIKVFLPRYERTCLKDVFARLRLGRRQLIDSAIISDEEYVRRWLAVEYEGKSFDQAAPVIITERGERVRSKSEKIIADKLYMMNIPYRYECPLLLDGNLKVYPDFTVLMMPERREVYLEHFGMLDDVDYVGSAINKVDTYERNGIILGVNLFITHETSRRPLNTKSLDRLIRNVFLP